VAVRVLAGAPPEAPPPLVAPVGAVAVLVVGVVLALLGPVGELAAPEVPGAPATDTVLVAPPHPPSGTVAAAARAAVVIASVEARMRAGWIMRLMVLSGAPSSRTPCKAY
jgi:hypothetical protein